MTAEGLCADEVLLLLLNPNLPLQEGVCVCFVSLPGGGCGSAGALCVCLRCHVCSLLLLHIFIEPGRNSQSVLRLLKKNPNDIRLS